MTIPVEERVRVLYVKLCALFLYRRVALATLPFVRILFQQCFNF
jgi:hypothetical protein